MAAASRDGHRALQGRRAYPYPSRLGTWAAVDVGDVNGHRWARWRNRDAGLFTSFDLRTELFVGAPTSREPRGFFAGAMAELKVYSSPMAASEARCIFQEGDQTLPGAPLRLMKKAPALRNLLKQRTFSSRAGLEGKGGGRLRTVW